MVCYAPIYPYNLHASFAMHRSQSFGLDESSNAKMALCLSSVCSATAEKRFCPQTGRVRENRLDMHNVNEACLANEAS